MLIPRCKAQFGVFQCPSEFTQCHLRPQLGQIKPPNRLCNPHGSHAHHKSHESIHSVVVQPVMACLDAPALLALYMSTPVLSSR